MTIIPDALALFGELLMGVVRGNTSLIAGVLRRWYYRTACRIDTNVYITRARNFEAGRNSVLYHAS